MFGGYPHVRKHARDPGDVNVNARILAAACFMPCVIVAQQPAPARDSVRLVALQEDALRTDPRQREIDLQAAQTQLRLRTIAADHLPALLVNGFGQYQSQVTSIPISLPGFSIPVPPHDTYDAHLEAKQSLYDPTIAPRRALEHAQLAESQAQLRTTVFGLRQEVNESFFAAVSLQQRASDIATTVTELGGRLVDAISRVRQGTALPSDTSAIAVTILQRRQDAVQVAADRRAALAKLSALAGHRVGESDILALPDGAADVERARSAIDSQRARPEYAQFARTRDRLERQADISSSQLKPHLSAFANLGYGRPGLNQLSTAFSSYWLGGLRVQWTPWDWGTTNRDRESLNLQQAIVAADEAAFTDELRRGAQSDLATIDRLDSALVFDDRIVALREQIDRETAVRFHEGVVTATEYVDRSTDLLAARLARDAHSTDAAQARAQFLLHLGIEVR
jgi:outer membrane protein TolC